MAEIATLRLETPGTKNLDPVIIYLDDMANGRGRMTLVCFTRSWTSYWGAMGQRGVMDFVMSASADYLANSLCTRLPMPAKARADEEKYVMRIVTHVKEFLVERDKSICPNCDTPVPPGCAGLFTADPPCRMRPA